jgi:endonuclease-3
LCGLPQKLSRRYNSFFMAAELKKRLAEIIRRLKKIYPDARVELDFSTPFELLIASVLAAQNTDANVNSITPTLFRKYSGPQDFLSVDLSELEKDIYSTGFFRQKAKTIQAISKCLIERFGGNVPSGMEEMLSLPGVGRKTANVVLGEAMGLTTGIVVDTHNIRLAARLKLSDKKTADKIEKDLMKLVPKRDWIKFGQLITWHGRRVCKARKPNCSACVISDLCPSSQLTESGKSK